MGPWLMYGDFHAHAMVPGALKKFRDGIPDTDTPTHLLSEYPEGPSTRYLRLLVPKPIPPMVFGTRDHKYWVLGPSRVGMDSSERNPKIRRSKYPNFEILGPRTFIGL